MRNNDLYLMELNQAINCHLTMAYMHGQGFFSCTKTVLCSGSMLISIDAIDFVL